MATEVRLDGAALAELLRGERGPVVRAVTEGSVRVQLEARRLVGKDTLDLSRNIIRRPFVRGGDFGVLVGSELPYARIAHDGRGPVRAKPGKTLRFRVGGQVIFRKSVGPAAGTFYLLSALPKALP